MIGPALWVVAATVCGSRVATFRGNVFDWAVFMVSCYGFATTVVFQ